MASLLKRVAAPVARNARKMSGEGSIHPILAERAASAAKHNSEPPWSPDAFGRLGPRIGIA